MYYKIANFATTKYKREICLFVQTATLLFALIAQTRQKVFAPTVITI